MRCVLCRVPQRAMKRAAVAFGLSVAGTWGWRWPGWRLEVERVGFEHREARMLDGEEQGSRCVKLEPKTGQVDRSAEQTTDVLGLPCRIG